MRDPTSNFLHHLGDPFDDVKVFAQQGVGDLAAWLGRMVSVEELDEVGGCHVTDLEPGDDRNGPARDQDAALASADEGVLLLSGDAVER